MSMSASSEALTECSCMHRRCATAATPAVRQLARPERTSSTGVGALSSAAKTWGWSASTVNVLLRDCSAPSPKKLPIAERLCVPFSHSQLARHLNFAASGTSCKDSRAPSSAVTLTPLSTFSVVDVLVIIVSVSCVVSRLKTLNCPVLLSARPYPSGARRSGHAGRGFRCFVGEPATRGLQRASAAVARGCALLCVVHQHGSDLAAIEANIFEHAVVESDELCRSSAEAPREESREGFLHRVEKPGPRRLGWYLCGQ